MNKLLLLVVPCFVLLSGCNKGITNTSSDEDYFTVKLNLKGDITTTESPLTKGGESDALFGVWIGMNGSERNDTFGGGLFDTFDNITVKLREGNTYNFRCTLITNGKTVINHDSYGRYGIPFSYYADSGTYLTNKIGYRVAGIETDNAKNGYNMLGINAASVYTADRYYWEVSNYSPTVNGTLDVELRHVVVGVKYQISGLTDGTVALTIKRGYDTIISESAISSDGEGEGAFFECSDIVGAFNYPDAYKEKATVSLVWTRGINIVQDLGRVEVELLRNRMNIININLGASDGDATLGINVDQTEMANESLAIELN